MINYDSSYFQPESLKELAEILPRLTESSVVLAGGTDLLPELRKGLREPDAYLSLWGLPELKQIVLEDGWLRIGAMVTHDQAASDPFVEKYFYGLKMACMRVGSQQIRNKGTLCGSIANASPAGDIMPCAYLYGGEIEITGQGGVRRIKAEEFQGENGRKKLYCGEVITALCLPVCEDLRSCFVKLGSRREVTIAQISLCAAWKGELQAETELRAFVGAVDVTPVTFDGRELPSAAKGDLFAAGQASERLSGLIRAIRLRRKRDSKLKLTEAEKLYKERAAGGVICDMAEAMKMVEAMKKAEAMKTEETVKAAEEMKTEETVKKAEAMKTEEAISMAETVKVGGV